MLSGILVALASSSSFVGAMRLEQRAAQTSAICDAKYQWMNNQGGDSPCLAAARLGAICNSGNWVIGSLIAPNGTSTYGNPSGLKANFCTCSWSYYNLISACTACQGLEYLVSIWSSYKAGCAGLESSTYFPANFTLPTSVTIPFWAGTNPTQWPNEQFSVSAAQQIDDKGHADLGTAPPPAKKSNNIGPIVGGVIGGVVVIGAAVALAIYILRRNKSRNAANQNQMQHTGDSNMYGHMRSLSGATQKSDLTSGGHIYSTLTSTPMFTNAPTSPTIQTHPASSVHSVPYLGSLMAGTASPPPHPGNISRQHTPPVNREDIVVPYTEPPNGREFSDRKHPGGPGIVYDSPDAPPPNVAAMRMEIIRPSTPPRARFNPPAYSETSPEGSAGPSATPRRLHGKKGSADTNHSFSSSVPRAQSPTITIATTPVNPLALYNPSSSSPHHPPANNIHGESNDRQLASPSRDEKRLSPQSDSFYGNDLA
ncbi:hypothetical protein CVT24_004784 [Panaeolus cyanescens]|uniref:Uncharacterized protein n=1 Tax=Panaeolus cyanescens TaxID=181874 RepID=A0A409V9U9_9AGAR|nr:hypothetical protein CVT24_004784 [Panaeolus cyanescens]